ncbi:MAG: pantoate kinase [Candidatus Bathyarchaeia archaeon]
MGTARAFAPSHITGIFQICEHSDPLRIGSRGAGVCLTRGVSTRVIAKRAVKWKPQVKIDGRRIPAGVSHEVVKLYADQAPHPCELLVEHKMEMPVGCGFGLSGASALSLSLALNEALSIGLSMMECAQMAHVAEINRKTGLGTVLAETFGGFEVRTKPGAPGIGSVMKVPAKPGCKVFSAHVGPLSTKRILRRPGISRLAYSSKFLIDGLAAKPSVEEIMRCSRIFSDSVNLYTQRLRRLKTALEARGVDSVTMNMFGEALFGVGDDGEVENFRRVCEELNLSEAQVIVSEVDDVGARIVD